MPFTMSQIPLDEDRGRGPHSTGGSSQGKSGKAAGGGASQTLAGGAAGATGTSPKSSSLHPRSN
jgi:hypothetical protein